MMWVNWWKEKGDKYTVSPYKLFINSGSYYLPAFDDYAQYMRTYGIDFIKKAHSASKPYVEKDYIKRQTAKWKESARCLPLKRIWQISDKKKTGNLTISSPHGGDKQNRAADLLNVIPDDFKTRIKYLKKIENGEDM